MADERDVRAAFALLTQVTAAMTAKRKECAEQDRQPTDAELARAALRCIEPVLADAAHRIGGPVMGADQSSSLSTAELAAAAGVTTHVIGYWAACGFLVPAQVRTSYRGGRRWAPEEAEHARRMARLVAAGLTPRRACRFSRQSWPKGEIGPGIVIEVREVPEQ